MSKVLVIRLSAFGDVAMLVPVVYSVANEYPNDSFTILTKEHFTPLFMNLCPNVDTITFDTTNRHKGLKGILKIIWYLSTLKFTHIADEHNVLRSKIIRCFLGLKGIKKASIDKGRKEKSLVVATKNIHELKSTVNRYKEVFDRLGFDFRLNFKSIFEHQSRDKELIESLYGKKEEYWIGIAPFARHKGKIYPLDKMEKVIAILSNKTHNKIFLFGNGKNENQVLNEWQKKYKNLINTSGKENLTTELLLISYLDVMISMDSANMHLASLTNTPVVSIWGATHPSLGFYGYNQDRENSIQINLECRPCSIYGNKDCFRKDYACLQQIDENLIVNKVNNILIKHKS